MEVLVFDGQFFIDGFPVRRGFKIENEKKLLSYIARSGAGCAPIEEIGGEIRFEKGAFRAIYWKKGVEIRPPVRRIASPKVIELSTYGQPIRVEIREGANGSIAIESSARTEFFPSRDLTNARAEILSGQSAAILDLRAKTEIGDYIALFALTREGAKLLLEGAGEIETKGNDVTIKERLFDARDRTRISRYFWQGASFALTERTFERGASPVFGERNAGRLLLEAALAGDEEDILSYLSPEIANAEEIKRYFGAFDKIRDPLFTSSETAIAVQKRLPDRTVSITYDFTFDGGKIQNILCEE
ncbi:MAG: hypothetical protein K5753_02070 [Clostridia bacterium]|nr:hypothetical protein [Clostridia bacterium]